MIPGARQLITPLTYLRVRHKIKLWFDLILPLILSVGLSLGICLLPGRVNVFGDQGLVSHVTQLLQMLIGFYIAALAAVATFPSTVLDQNFSGEQAKLKVLRKGQKLDVPLNRRRFLCYLFGYLAFESLALFIVGMTVTVLHENLVELFPAVVLSTGKRVFIFMYLFLLSNLLVTTLLGLHYLTDRIHRPPDGNVAESKDRTASTWRDDDPNDD